MSDVETAEELRHRADATEAAEAFQRGEIAFDYDQAGKVPLPPRPTEEPMVVCTLRLPPDLYLRIKKIADDLHVRPSAFMRELLESAIAERASEEPVLVRPSELRRAIDQIVHRAA